MRVAFLGTGLMGSRMAARLLDAGHELAVWNRTPDKAAPLAARGARAAATPAEAAAGAEATISMLADGPAVTGVLFEQGVADALARGSLFVDMSSIPPATARAHAEELRERGVGALDAPVSGGTKGAEEGTLAIMVGGEEADAARALDLLAPLGRPTRVGGPGSGQLAKLVNQVICAVSIGAVAEGLLLAQAGGADPAAVREALFGGFADGRVLREHGLRMVERDWSAGGLTRMQLKDLNTVLDVAGDLSLDLPLAEATRGLFAALAEYGAELDHSAVLVELERRNGRA